MKPESLRLGPDHRCLLKTLQDNSIMQLKCNQDWAPLIDWALALPALSNYIHGSHDLYDRIYTIKSQNNGGNILLPELRCPWSPVTQGCSLLATEWKRDHYLLIAYIVPATMHISSSWTSQQPYEVDIIHLTLYLGKKCKAWEINLPSHGGWGKICGIWTQVWAHWSKTINVFCCPLHVSVNCPPACFLGGMGKTTFIKSSAT